MKYRSPIISYLKVGYLLHFMTIAEIILLIAIFRALDLERWVEGHYSLLKSMALIPFFSMPFFAQLDARSRYQNYKKLKDQLYRFGYHERIMKPILKSRCQRDAAIAAAVELGLGEKCSEYFYSCGYRWYHLLPDFVFKKPQFLFSRFFWKTTFFVREYRPVYNFRVLKPVTESLYNYAGGER